VFHVFFARVWAKAQRERCTQTRSERKKRGILLDEGDFIKGLNSNINRVILIDKFGKIIEIQK